MKTCSVDGCGSKVLAKGLCGKHYQRKLYTGSIEPRARLADELCSCGQRFAKYRNANGQPLEHPLCQVCYRRVLRSQAERVKFVCARAACGKEFTLLRARREDQPNYKKYCSRDCKNRARIEDGRMAEDT